MANIEPKAPEKVKEDRLTALELAVASLGVLLVKGGEPHAEEYFLKWHAQLEPPVQPKAETTKPVSKNIPPA